MPLSSHSAKHQQQSYSKNLEVNPKVNTLGIYQIPWVFTIFNFGSNFSGKYQVNTYYGKYPVSTLPGIYRVFTWVFT